MKNSKSPDQELQEAITKHIEQVLVASQIRSDEALDNFPFQVLFAADEQENVKITVRWPEDQRPSKAVSILSAMLCNITDGSWKPPIFSAVQKQGQETQQVDTANGILQAWSNIVKEFAENTVCVSPRQVFARNNNGSTGNMGGMG